LYFCQVLEGYDPGFCWLLSVSLTLAIRYRSICASQAVLVVDNLPANAGRDRDVNLILGLGGSPGEGNGDLHQYSCLGKSRGQRSLGGLWSVEAQRVGHDWATVHVEILQALQRLSKVLVDPVHTVWQQRNISLVIVITHSSSVEWSSPSPDGIILSSGGNHSCLEPFQQSSGSWKL